MDQSSAGANVGTNKTSNNSDASKFRTNENELQKAKGSKVDPQRAGHGWDFLREDL